MTAAVAAAVGAATGTGGPDTRETAELTAAGREARGREALARVRAEIARLEREEEEANNNARADEIVAAMGGAAPTAEPGEERNETNDGVATRPVTAQPVTAPAEAIANLVPKSTPETAPTYTALELLQLDPFAFLCELYARISRAYPGAVLCSERHGANSQLAAARAVAVVIVTQGSRARQCADQGFAKNRDASVPVEEFIAPTLWRVEALLALLDGAAAPPVRTNPRADVARILTRLGFAGQNGVADDAAGCMIAAMRSIDGPVENKAALINTWCGHMGDVSEGR